MTNAPASHPALERPSVHPADRIGIDSVNAVYRMEDHDEALRVWQREKFSDRVLLHIDAHIDFDWIPEKSTSDLLNVSSLQQLNSLAQQRIFWDLTDRKADSFVHIGNYVCLALQQGILSAFYWVTPEAPAGISWRGEIHRLLQNFHRQHPNAFHDIRVEGPRLRASLYGLPLTVCTLKNLPSIAEEVLLDIDTDFLISGFLTEKEDPRLKKPWLFPEDLIETLKTKGIRSDCVTIAYSVEGGFTPLRYKYFGDALAQMIQNPSSTIEGYDRKRAAQRWEEKGKPDAAVAAYREALRLNPMDAASLYNLSLLLLAQGQKDEASRLYQRAVAADRSYSTSYNNFGPLYAEQGQWEKAEEEYKKIRALDPRNAPALCGLGDAFRLRKDLSRARLCYEEALLKSPELAEAYYGLGRIFFEKKQWDEALGAFQSALKLKKGLEAKLAFWVGATLFKKKRFGPAKEMLLEAMRLGLRFASLHLYLSRIYFSEGLYYKTGKEVGRFLLCFLRIPHHA